MDVAEMIEELLSGRRMAREDGCALTPESDGEAVVQMLRYYGHLDPTETYRFRWANDQLAERPPKP